MDAKMISALKNLVRVGEISSVDAGTRTARVIFPDKKDVYGKAFTSKPLGVIYTESVWLPDIGELVVCLFLPNGDGDGFVLGRCK